MNTQIKTNIMLKTEYRKRGVVVTIGGLTAIDGFAFETTDNFGKPLKGIITNGKLRRFERRKVVNALLHALDIGYLEEFRQFGDGVRGAIAESVVNFK